MIAAVQPAWKTQASPGANLSITCYKCNGPNHFARDYVQSRQTACVPCYQCTKTTLSPKSCPQSCFSALLTIIAYVGRDSSSALQSATCNAATINVLVTRKKPLDYNLLFGIDSQRRWVASTLRVLKALSLRRCSLFVQCFASKKSILMQNSIIDGERGWLLGSGPQGVH